jgi:four helix bundle protein
MGDFKKLKVWQNAKNLAVSIYKISKEENISRDFGFKDQIQRAAVSIPANIAEGDELDTDKQSTRHFYIAKGSSAELQTLIIIGNEVGYIPDDLSDHLVNECKIISVMLTKLIRARS